jgi:hypothetical protein
MSDLTPYSDPYPPPLPPPTVYTDRSGALTAVGILQLGLALLCLLFLAFVAFAMVMARTVPEGRAASPGSMLAGGLVYLAAGVFFGTLGVGTLQGRRWARTIGLVTSWMWLLLGILVMVAMVFLLPKMSTAMTAAAGSGATPGTGLFIVGCVGFFLFLVYLVLPLILLLFYRGANVRATFEAKDPSLPWTDRVPPQVLALSLLFGLSALGSLFGLSYRVFPFFGMLLTGAPAILGFLVSGALCAVLARGLYRRRPAAWWGAVAFWLVGCVNGALIFVTGGVGIRRIYEAIGMSAMQLHQMEKMGIYDYYSSPGTLVLFAVTWLGALGFMIWCRRFFIDAPGAPAAY